MKKITHIVCLALKWATFGVSISDSCLYIVNSKAPFYVILMDMTTIYWSNEDICQSTSKRVRFCLWLNKYICISIFPGFLCKWSTTNGTTYDLYTGLADGRQFPRLYSLNKTFLTFRLAIIKKRYLVSCYHNTLQYVYISADIYVFKIS